MEGWDAIGGGLYPAKTYNRRRRLNAITVFIDFHFVSNADERSSKPRGGSNADH